MAHHTLAHCYTAQGRLSGIRTREPVIASSIFPANLAISQGVLQVCFLPCVQFEGPELLLWFYSALTHSLLSSLTVFTTWFLGLLFYISHLDKTVIHILWKGRIWLHNLLRKSQKYIKSLQFEWTVKNQRGKESYLCVSILSLTLTAHTTPPPIHTMHTQYTHCTDTLYTHTAQIHIPHTLHTTHTLHLLHTTHATYRHTYAHNAMHTSHTHTTHTTHSTHIIQITHTAQTRTSHTCIHTAHILYTHPHISIPHSVHTHTSHTQSSFLCHNIVDAADPYLCFCLQPLPSKQCST